MDRPDPTPEAVRWARIQELLADALELQPDQRAAYLAGACEDEEIRAEVESLIEVSEASDAFFDGLADRAGITLSSDTRESVKRKLPDAPSRKELGPELVGRQIGQYRIQEWLGRGGMASVYLAEREGEGFVQRVALKVVSTKVSDPLVQRRSNEERRILARLEHHGIARLIDGGVTPDGYPFYAMEYVEGKDVLRHCDDQRLDLEARLRLFLEVCIPVQYAHERLVVHCDLKPGNIFVTPRGEAKLLDFGVARLIDPNAAGTGDSGLWFTPAYASPEQVRREPPGAASDVYSLGVILYELLTGHRPYRFSSMSREDVATVVGELIPPVPSDRVHDPAHRTVEEESVEITPEGLALSRRTTPEELGRRLRGDLDAIVMKALAKDPAQRYHTADQLAADIRRHLDHEPVSSVPPTPRYRARKFVRRNRGALSAAAMIVLALGAGAGAALWQASRATRAAEVAADEADKARMVADLMGDLFRLSDPSETLGDTITARDLLDRGTERIRTEFGDQPVVQAELLSEVARVYSSLGLFRRARALVDTALTIREEEFGPESLEATASMIQLGSLDLSLSDPGLAIPMLDRAIALREAVAPRPDPLLVQARSALGWAVRDAGDYERAVTLFNEALKEQERLDPTPAAVADLMYGLAASYHDEGMLDEADSLFNDILARAGPGARPTRQAVAALQRVGMVRRLREQFREADPILAEAVALGTRLYGPEHPVVLEARQDYAMNLWGLGRWEEAEASLRETQEIAQRTLGPWHETTAGIGEGLAYVLEDLGEIDEAVILQQASLEEKARRHGGRDHAGVVASLASVARTLALAGRSPEAVGYLDRADEMLDRLGSRRSVYSISLERTRGLLAMADGDFEAADRHFRLAVELADELLSRPSHRFATGAKFEYATMLLAADRRGEARALLQELDSLLLLRVDESHPDVARTRALLEEARAG